MSRCERWGTCQDPEYCAQGGRCDQVLFPLGSRIADLDAVHRDDQLIDTGAIPEQLQRWRDDIRADEPVLVDVDTATSVISSAKHRRRTDWVVILANAGTVIIVLITVFLVALMVLTMILLVNGSPPPWPRHSPIF